MSFNRTPAVILTQLLKRAIIASSSQKQGRGGNAGEEVPRPPLHTCAIRGAQSTPPAQVDVTCHMTIRAALKIRPLLRIVDFIASEDEREASGQRPF